LRLRAEIVDALARAVAALAGQRIPTADGHEDAEEADAVRDGCITKKIPFVSYDS